MNKVNLEQRGQTAPPSAVSGRAEPPRARHRPNQDDRKQFDQAMRNDERGSHETLQIGAPTSSAESAEFAGFAESKQANIASFDSNQASDASPAPAGRPWLAEGEGATSVDHTIAAIDASATDLCAALSEGISSGAHCFEVCVNGLGPIDVQCSVAVAGGFLVRLSAREARVSRWLAGHRDSLQSVLDSTGGEHILLAVEDTAQGAQGAGGL